eukprot:8598484-Alexandrium_andersonii.AAC.1
MCIRDRTIPTQEQLRAVNSTRARAWGHLPNIPGVALADVADGQRGASDLVPRPWGHSAGPDASPGR